MRSSHGTSSGRGMCGPASQCHSPPPNVGRVPPRGVGDHVAVVAEQRLDHLEDLRMPDDTLARGAPVEHLVAELVPVVARRARAATASNTASISVRSSATSAA